MPPQHLHAVPGACITHPGGPGACTGPPGCPWASKPHLCERRVGVLRKVLAHQKAGAPCPRQELPFLSPRLVLLSPRGHQFSERPSSQTPKGSVGSLTCREMCPSARPETRRPLPSPWCPPFYSLHLRICPRDLTPGRPHRFRPCAPGVSHGASPGQRPSAR